jgi:3'(2'), 5'-bisphosphate nucleotidase
MSYCDLAALSDACLVNELTEPIWQAATAVLAIDQSTVKWHAKADLSPVSAVDEAANAVITQGLLRLLPGVTIVSEEETARIVLCKRQVLRPRRSARRHA